MYEVFLTLIVAINILISSMLLAKLERIQTRVSLHFRKHRRPPPRKGLQVCANPRPNRRVLL